jgi:hypothetical protein
MAEISDLGYSRDRWHGLQDYSIATRERRGIF